MKEYSLHILMTANCAWNLWNFRRGLIVALLSDGHRLTLLAPPDGTVANLEGLGCRFVPLSMSTKGMNPFKELNFLRRLHKTFKIHRADIILSYTIKNNIFGALAARSLNIPFIPNVTGLGAGFLSSGSLRVVVEILYRISFKSPIKVFFQNNDDEELFVRRNLVDSRKCFILPGSGIDLNFFIPAEYPRKDVNTIFLMIGRLIRTKGLYEFTKAARQIKSRYPQARFKLLGPQLDAQDGDAVGALELQAWQEEGIIEYLGVTDDVRPHISAAHCIVLPSYREGVPRSVIEAASMARPVIVTNVAGCREVVKNGVTGYLCRPRDMNDLAQKFEQFMALPYYEKFKMGNAGRAMMEANFDEANVIKAYRSAIATICIDPQ